jgi:FkbM family methyltransferase
MNGELKILRTLGAWLPPVTGAGLLGNVLRDFYARRQRQRVVVDVLGVQMDLEPSENVDGTLLFCPQLYDRRELAALLPVLGPGDVFVDVGSHIGLYALLAARRVAPGGRVLAIEADPRNHERLTDNLRRNPGLAIETACVAVSDSEGTAMLAQNTTGNRGGNSILAAGDAAIQVPCRTLASVLAERGIDRVDGMKLDIEGMEYRVLRRYFEDVRPEARPRVIVYEHQPAWIEKAGGDASALLRAAGYRRLLATAINQVVVRD